MDGRFCTAKRALTDLDRSCTNKLTEADAEVENIKVCHDENLIGLGLVVILTLRRLASPAKTFHHKKHRIALFLGSSLRFRPHK